MGTQHIFKNTQATVLCISYFQEKSIEHGHPTSATLRPTSEYDIKHMAHLFFLTNFEEKSQIFQEKAIENGSRYVIPHKSCKST